jgi:hypothetical protein
MLITASWFRSGWIQSHLFDARDMAKSLMNRYKSGMKVESPYACSYSDISETTLDGNKAYKYYTVPTQAFTMDFKVGGKGVAFGKVAETDNLVDSAWPIQCPTAIFTEGEYALNTNDILADTELLSDSRAKFFTMSRSAYTGNVPNSLYQYGGGYGIKRGSNSMWAVIFPSSSSAQPIVNYNGGNGWVGWQSFLTTAGTADYVTLQTTSGIWTYRQWASGVAECWGKYSESTAAAFDPTGNVYYRVLPTISIPGGWFNSKPTVTVGLDFGNIGAAQVSVSSATALQVAILSAVSSARACVVSLHCRGTWK